MRQDLNLSDWLAQNGLSKYLSLLTDHAVDMDILATLDDADLKELEISLGDRKRFRKALSELQSPADEGERRQVTVLFCDMVGFTQLSDQLDPEDLENRVAEFMRICETEVAKWGGHIANYLGDGLLVYFGWPQTLEATADHAVRAGLEIIKAVRAITPDNDGSDAIKADARVGIATGMVLVGKRMGGGDTQVEAVFGSTPNLAARLESMAAPGEVYVADSTKRLLKQEFNMLDVGSFQVKGFREDVQVWKALSQDGDAAPAAQPQDGSNPIVGRETLVAALAAYDRTVLAEGSAHSVILRGDAGIGKSHLLRHFQNRQRELGRSIQTLNCWPYRSDSTLYPIIDCLLGVAGCKPSDTPDVMREKFEAHAAALGLPAELFTSELGDLLDIGTVPADKFAVSRKKIWFRALGKYVRHVSEGNPMTIFVEDAHWLDKSTEEFLAHLVTELADRSVMIVITARPEFSPDWQSSPQSHELAIPRLDHRAAEKLITRVADGRALPDALLQKILELTDGVPLYLEEFTRSVLDQDLSDGDSFDIPATLHDVLLARLDATAQAKATAQKASCIGRVFSKDMLSAITNDPPSRLAAHIDRLIGADILYREGAQGVEIYSFRHALIQEAAYQSQPRRLRRRIHAAIAKTLESQPDADSVSIANHYTVAQDVENAIRFWTQAAERARSRSAQREAVNYFRRALEQLEKLPETPHRAQRELDLRLALAPELMATHGYGQDAVRETYDRVEYLADRLDDTDDKFEVRRGRWLFEQMCANYVSAIKVAQQMHEIADKSGRSDLLLQADRALGATAFVTGKLDMARRHLEATSAQYSAQQGKDVDHDAGLASISYLGRSLWFLGFPDSSLKRSREALNIARKVAQPFSLARTLVFVGHSHHLRGEMSQLLPVASEAISVSRRYGFPFFLGVGQILHGAGQMGLGNLDDGRAEMEQGFAEYETSGSMMSKPWFLMLLADAARKSGDLAEAHLQIDAALLLAAQTGEALVQPECLRVRGEICLAENNNSQAIDDFQRAYEIARQQNSLSCQLRAAINLTRIDPQKIAMLKATFERFSEGAKTADHGAADALLAQVS